MQFNDHILKCFRVIAKNVTILIKHDCRRPTLSSRYDVIGDVIIMKFIFVDDLNTVLSFYSWCQIEAILKIAKF